MNAEQAVQRTPFLSSRSVLYFFFLWVTLAETLTVFGSVSFGVWCHAILLSTLITKSLREKSRPLARAWLTLAFAPLIRVISLAMPLSNFRLIYWYLLTGVPIFLSAVALFRYFRLPREKFSLQAKWSLDQWLVGLTGLGLGYVEYLILQPQPLIWETTILAVLEALIILVVFIGLAEEVIFRGLMQHAVERVFGGTGVVYVAGIFAVLHLGYRSLADLIFVFLVALYFGYYVRHTRSIFGVTLAHGLTNVSLFIIFPFLVGHAAVGDGAISPAVISPPLVTPTITPTPFMPSTPTPFMPLEPTPTESSTPTPEVSAGSESVEPTVSPSPTEEASAFLPTFPQVDGASEHSPASTISQPSRNSPSVGWRFWRLCARVVSGSLAGRPNALSACF